MKPERFEKLYAEITELQPSLEYCLAPKKMKQKQGAHRLRAGADVEVSGAPASTRLPEELKRHAQIVYERLLDRTQPSTIRLMIMWQSAGGLSFVSHAHFRVSLCYRYCGHEGGEVALSQFQEAVISRHTAGTSGMEEDRESGRSQYAAVDLGGA